MDLSYVERLRVSRAPEVTLATYTKVLPRRIERQIRASWIVAPALRNLFFRRTPLESASIAYHSNQSALGDIDAHGKEFVAVAQEIYGQLQKRYLHQAAGQTKGHRWGPL